MILAAPIEEKARELRYKRIQELLDKTREAILKFHNNPSMRDIKIINPLYFQYLDDDTIKRFIEKGFEPIKNKEEVKDEFIRVSKEYKNKRTSY